MKIILPKEHGAWAMWIAPYLIGILITNIKWTHIPLLISIFFTYIAISPFLQGIRRPKERKELWRNSFSYLTIAFLAAIPIFVAFPGILYVLLFIFPLFLINIYFAKKRNDRALLNDLAAMAALNSTIFAAYYIGANQYTLEVLLIWLLTLLFFFGSALYVKSMFRERQSITFINFAKLYMLAVLLIGVAFNNQFLFIAFLFSTLRFFVSSLFDNLTTKKVGIIEIINTIWFVIFIVLSFS